MLTKPTQNNNRIDCLSGTVASPGVAIAQAFVLNTKSITINSDRIDRSDIDLHQQWFYTAREKSLNQLRCLSEKARKKLGDEEAEVFEGFIVMLEDEELEEEVLGMIQRDMRTCDFCIHAVMQNNIKQLQQLQDSYLRARADDMQDLLQRMINNLYDENSDITDELANRQIVVADNLSPAQTLELNLDYVQGFVTGLGGGLSHTAILARSLGLPAIVNIQDKIQGIKQGDMLIVDADNNKVIVNPDNTVLSYYREYEKSQAESVKKNQPIIDKPLQTREGKTIQLYANIGSNDEVDAANRQLAQGVGLFRSEFLFMGRDAAPSEQEQFEIYRQALEKMNGKPVILRTLDIGGDKHIPYLGLSQEDNPFLGRRAIRLCFDYPDVLHTQLRAAIRASVYGKLKLMFPMIISVEEVRQLRTIIAKIFVELRESQVAFDKTIEIGAMIETPAAVMIADELINELDFFSIGTNDLTQYILAVDRCNSDIAHLYNPLHPAVLRAIKWVVDAAHRAEKWVGVCGEMAACQKACLILAGFGVDELSVTASAIPGVKLAINAYTNEQLQQLAAEVIEASEINGIESILNKFIADTKIKYPYQ